MHWILILHFVMSPSAPYSSAVSQEFDDFDSCKQALDAAYASFPSPYRLPVGFCAPKGRAPDVCVYTLPANPTDAPQQKCTPGELPKAVFSDARR